MRISLNKRYYCVVTLVISTLISCGGGGGSSSADSAVAVVPPQPIQALQLVSQFLSHQTPFIPLEETGSFMTAGNVWLQYNLVLVDSQSNQRFCLGINLTPDHSQILASDQFARLPVNRSITDPSQADLCNHGHLYYQTEGTKENELVLLAKLVASQSVPTSIHREGQRFLIRIGDALDAEQQPGLLITNGGTGSGARLKLDIFSVSENAIVAEVDLQNDGLGQLYYQNLPILDNPGTYFMVNGQLRDGTGKLSFGAEVIFDIVEVESFCAADNEITPDEENRIYSFDFNYPYTVNRSDNDDNWLMYTGGFSHLASEEMLATTPEGGPEHIVFEDAQETIWVAELNQDFSGWANDLSYAFQITPSTPVQLKGDVTYSELYPLAFADICHTDVGIPNQGGRCNVQINDPAVIRMDMEGDYKYLMYFSILENYRHYSSLLGGLRYLPEKGGYVPVDPDNQNRHAIGLAISNDGLHWEFVGKVLLESGMLDTDHEEVLGAWAPSVLYEPSTQTVMVYFHDSTGRKQYVAHLKRGSELQTVERLNKQDHEYRVNLNVIRRGDAFQVAYNDEDFGIQRMSFTSARDFGQACAPVTLVAAPGDQQFPTPSQLIDSKGNQHLYFWDFNERNYIFHWKFNSHPLTPGNFTLIE